MVNEPILVQLIDELLQLGEEKFFKTILMLNAITKKTKEINADNADLRTKLGVAERLMLIKDGANLTLGRYFREAREERDELRANLDTAEEEIIKLKEAKRIRDVVDNDLSLPDWGLMAVTKERDEAKQELLDVFDNVIGARCADDVGRHLAELRVNLYDMRKERDEARRQAFDFEKKYEEARTWEHAARMTAEALRGSESECEDLRQQVESITKVKNEFYDDMCRYKQACTDLINFRETLFGAIKKRDNQIRESRRQVKELKIEMEDNKDYDSYIREEYWTVMQYDFMALKSQVAQMIRALTQIRNILDDDFCKWNGCFYLQEITDQALTATSDNFSRVMEAAKEVAEGSEGAYIALNGKTYVPVEIDKFDKLFRLIFPDAPGEECENHE